MICVKLKMRHYIEIKHRDYKQLFFKQIPWNDGPKGCLQ